MTKLMGKYDLNAEEDELAALSGEIKSELYLTKTIEHLTEKLSSTLPYEAIRIGDFMNTAAEKLIESNEKLEKANDKYVKVTTGLTWAIVAFAAVEAFSTLAGVLTCK